MACLSSRALKQLQRNELVKRGRQLRSLIYRFRGWKGEISRPFVVSVRLKPGFLIEFKASLSSLTAREDPSRDNFLGVCS